MLDRQDRFEGERLAGLERWDDGPLVGLGGWPRVLGRFAIENPVAALRQHRPARHQPFGRLAEPGDLGSLAPAGAFRDDRGPGVVPDGRGHLGGDEPLPDHAVQLPLVLREKRRHLIGSPLDRRRPDCLVGVLRPLQLAEVVRPLGEEVASEPLADELPHLPERLLRDPGGVGPQVGDQSDAVSGAKVHPLVEPLCGAHGPRGREAEQGGRLPLHGAGDEGRGSFLLAVLRLDLRHPVVARLEKALDRPGRGLLARRRLPREALRNFGGRPQRGAVAGQQERVDRPVLLDVEGPDLAFARADQAESHRLHAPGGETGSDLAGKERRDLVADDPVQHPARLLGLDLVPVHLGRALQRAPDRRRGDLVEGDPLDRDLASRRQRAEELLREVVADRFSFPVRVGREVDAGGLFCRPLEALEDLGPVRNHFELRAKTVRDVHREAPLRQVPDVSSRGHDPVGAPQKPLDGLGLGGGFDDDECVSHDVRSV